MDEGALVAAGEGGFVLGDGFVLAVAERLGEEMSALVTNLIPARLVPNNFFAIPKSPRR